jgi:hypothetical protein
VFPKLNFPGYNFKIIIPDKEGQSSKVFDMVRRKYVSLTQEEWVRQHLIHFLVNEKGVPASLIGVEKKLLVNRITKRTDLVVYSRSAKPILVAECKAPSIQLSQDTFDQAARYNLTLNVNYFVLTNGLETICCTVDHTAKGYHFLQDIPFFDQL